MHTIYITGDIDNETFTMISRRLSKLEELHPPDWPVLINLSSDGGSAYAALAICDRIKQSPFRIDIHAYGLVASAATLILACGNKRYMSRNAWVMVHEDEVEPEAGSRTSSIEAVARHSRRLENQWNELMAKYTKLTPKEWSDLDKAETYLTPEECLQYGLIDGII